MVKLTVPLFNFESKVVLYWQNIIKRCGVPVLLILNNNECKSEVENKEEIDCGNDRENQKENDEDSGKGYDDITMKGDVDLNCVRTHEEQLTL